jgi:hypothetical protein
MNRRHVVWDVGEHRSRINIASRWRVETAVHRRIGSILLSVVVLLSIFHVGSTKLQQAGLKIGQGPFNEAFSVLEMDQEAVPKLVLRQDLGVSKNNQAVLGSRECDVQTAWV